MSDKTVHTAHRFEALDALRGIAALAVLMFHFTLRRPQAALGFYWGVTCVDIFFLMSGFVIFFSLDRIKYWQEFVWKRFVRLYPTYWFCMLLTGSLLFYFYDSKSPSYIPFFTRFLANMTMFQTWFGQKDLDGPYWTMIVELQFYAIMLLLYRLKQLKNFELIGLGILIFCSLYGLDNWHAHLPSLFGFLSTHFPILNHFPVFYAGVLFYLGMKEGFSNQRVLLLLASFTVQLILFDDGGRSHSYISFGKYIIAMSLYYGLFTLFVKQGLNFIAQKPFLFLGKISYPMYLIHQFLGLWVLIPIFMKWYHFSYWSACGTTLLIIVTIAFLIHKYIEVPTGKWLGGLVKFK